MHRSTELHLPSFTVVEAAAVIGVPRMKVYRLIERGALAAHKDVGGVLRIPYGELYSYIKEREVEEIAQGVVATSG